MGSSDAALGALARLEIAIVVRYLRRVMRHGYGVIMDYLDTNSVQAVAARLSNDTEAGQRTVSKPHVPPSTKLVN